MSEEEADFIEYGEVTYKKTDSERAPKIEIGFKVVVRLENVSEAIDMIAEEFKHLKEGVTKTLYEKNYYGSSEPATDPEAGSTEKSQRLNLSKQRRK